METCEIIWTARAVKDLKKVYQFYSEQIGEERAFKIIQHLLDKVDVLSDSRFVKIGPTDTDFNYLKRNYKKLVVQNIKITYRINPGKSIVFINRVFDMRQHPNKNR